METDRETRPAARGADGETKRAARGNGPGAAKVMGWLATSAGRIAGIFKPFWWGIFLLPLSLRRPRGSAMKTFACLTAIAASLCWNTAACVAQQARGPATLENLVNSSEAQGTPVVPGGADSGPKRPAGTVARPKDGVQHADLDKAWAEYDATVAKAAESIKAAITKQFDAAAAKGDLDAAEKWQAALEKFEKAGEVPAQSEAKAAVSAAVGDYKKAKEELAEAYEAVVKALTREKKLPEARIVREESRSLEQVPPAPNPKPQPKPAPVVAKQNLLLDCDAIRDAVSGKWIKLPEGIQSDSAAPAKMKIPVRDKLPKQYDFEIEFTPLRGELCVTQLISAYGTGFGCDFGGWGNSIVAFQLVDGRFGDNNRSTTRRPAWLAAGRRHMAVIQVRQNGVAAFLDGQHVVTLPTDYSNLKHRNDWSIPIDSIGIGSWATPTLFHRATVIPK